MEKADRYTVLTTSFDNLGEKLKACALLGLHFFVRNDARYSDTCIIYIFFDNAGVQNYLGGHYDEEVQ